jgi:hypothetical protein
VFNTNNGTISSTPGLLAGVIGQQKMLVPSSTLVWPPGVRFDFSDLPFLLVFWNWSLFSILTIPTIDDVLWDLQIKIFKGNMIYQIDRNTITLYSEKRLNYKLIIVTVDSVLNSRWGVTNEVFLRNHGREGFLLLQFSFVKKYFGFNNCIAHTCNIHFSNAKRFA